MLYGIFVNWVKGHAPSHPPTPSTNPLSPVGKLEQSYLDNANHGFEEKTRVACSAKLFTEVIVPMVL
jgi:hypothetical protein